MQYDQDGDPIVECPNCGSEHTYSIYMETFTCGDCSEIFNNEKTKEAIAVIIERLKELQQIRSNTVNISGLDFEV